MVRRIRRSTVVFVEVVLAVVAAGVAVGVVRHGVVGYVLAGLAALVGILGLVRIDGRALLDLVVDRLRDPAADPTAGDGEHPGPDPGGAEPLVPGLHVSEMSTRDGTGLGVAGDGQGFVVVLDAGHPAPSSWALASLVEILVTDPARPAAAQVLVEQHGLADGDPRSAPGRSYRSLPIGGLPLWNRVLLAIRHEPAWAPEAVETRGGGATGARNALAAIAARTVARAAREGIRLHALDAAELAAALRDLGPESQLPPDTDVVLSVPLARDDAVSALLPALAELDVRRSVLAVTADAVDHSLRAVARLTDPRAGAARRAAAQLVADGLLTPLPPAQHDEGVLASLPLGGGARSLEGVVGQVRR
jgi:type VII secretion protein EccE